MRLVDVDWELNSCFSSFSGRWIHHDWIRSRMQPLCHTFQWGLLYHFVENHYCNDFNHISVMQSKENGIKSCMMFRLWAVLRLLNIWRHMKCKKHMHCFVHRPGKCHAGEPRDAQIPQKMIIPNQQEHSESLVKTSLDFQFFEEVYFPPTVLWYLNKSTRFWQKYPGLSGFFGAQWHLTWFSSLRCFAGCPTSLSWLSPWWATRNVARTWRDDNWFNQLGG